MDHYGIISLLPACIVIVIAVLTKRPIESLLAGTLAGLMILAPTDTIANFSSLALTTMKDPTTAWVILVCSLMGSLIVILTRTGAATAFAEAVTKRANSRRKALVSTWLLGIVIFIDDYLNALAVSTSMKKVTDKYKVSREMLAYIVDSTAAPLCILIPISTWSVFFVGVLESSNVASAGEGFSLYVSAIPYMLYAWIAALLVPLVALGYVPALGLMKKAEKLAHEGKPNIVEHNELDMGVNEMAKGKNISPWNFIIAILCLVGFAIWYDIDVLVGTIFALIISIPLFGFQKIIGWFHLFDSVIDGIKLMLPAVIIVTVAFMFKEVNNQLGLPDFVIEVVQPIMSPKLLPAVTFITMGLIAFATGSFWGVLAISVPVVVPLAESLDVHTPLVLGALLSASAFGSHACFYSDSTVLAAQGSDCDVMSHALTQLPYVLIAAGLSIIGLTILA